MEDGRWERDLSILTMKCTSRVATEKEEALDEEAEFWAKELESRSEGIAKLRLRVQV